MMFKNREEAARLLARRLAGYRGQNPLILTVPRGAVPMGRILAEELDGELDVALVRKIGVPGNPEFAVGSVAESGEIVVSPWAEEAGIPESWIEQEAHRQLAVLKERRRRYTPDRLAVRSVGPENSSAAIAGKRTPWPVGSRPRRDASSLKPQPMAVTISGR